MGPSFTTETESLLFLHEHCSCVWKVFRIPGLKISHNRAAHFTGLWFLLPVSLLYNCFDSSASLKSSKRSGNGWITNPEFTNRVAYIALLQFPNKHRGSNPEQGLEHSLNPPSPKATTHQEGTMLDNRSDCGRI